MKQRLWLMLFLLVALVPSAPAAEVNVYSARIEDLIKPLLDRFSEETGIDVNLVTGNADALLQRLQLEGRNTPADVLITTDVGRLHLAEARDLLQPVSSDILNETIPAQYRDPDNHWYGLSLRSRVVVYSKERVDPEELSTYEALADSKWADRLCVRSSSNVYNQSLVASLIAHNGEQATQEWANGLVENFARKPQGGDRDQIKAVAAGQCDIALVNTYYLAGMLGSNQEAEVNAAMAVGVFWPNQPGSGSDRGAHMNISGAGVTKAANNKAEAIKLLEFMLSDEAQRWYADKNFEYPVKPGVEANAILRQWGDFKADELALEKLGEYNAEAVRIMDRAGWK
ncbi:iron(III) transport system substrate-binding protein [Methylohalomonas lacus]|uniref:Iron(III) transport system substrate-binding protein n=1 Tax=Methylohalomonas lacus TaxID=398773 RepID=A0AAE3L0R7_9GAMM|nr:Fe(3+) ABC transporter substrate-binding protein [Methylohalomonas lacus]MCS3902066.1 iron(III) transport system substrate-binding protein [Methylohalomonas lacus]